MLPCRPHGSALGSLLEDAMVLRSAVSLSVAFFGARRASEVAALRVSDVRVREAFEDVKISVRCQKNDQFGVGQMAHMVALPSWKGACPIRLLSGRQWLRKWLTSHGDRLGRMSGPVGHTPMFTGLARACFGLGTAASSLSAAWKSAFDGRALSPRKGGTRLYFTNGMTRGAAQELRGWKSPASMGAVYDKTRSWEVPPKIRAAATNACAMLDVTAFVEDLDRDPCSCCGEFLGPDKGTVVHVWSHRFR